MARAGVQVIDWGNPVIRRCKIHEGANIGVLVRDSGVGTIEESEIFGHAFAEAFFATLPSVASAFVPTRPRPAEVLARSRSPADAMDAPARIAMPGTYRSIEGDAKAALAS